MVITRHPRGEVVVAVWSVVLAVLVLAPLVAPGYVLSYDMVAVPDQALLPSSVGLSSALPRAVPLDAVVAIVDEVVPGAILQRLALIAVVAGAAFGAGRMMPTRSTPIRLVAASAYAWNAYVFERLVIGHWPVLLAYAALPWLVSAARQVRAGRPGAAARGVVLVAVSSLTPTGGILAAVLFTALVVAPGGEHTRRMRATALGAAIALQAPWVLPGMLRPAAALSDGAGVGAFAARADAPGGVVGSVLTLGGIWNAGAVPDSRALVSSFLLSAVLVGLAAAGVREFGRRVGPAEARVLAVLAGCGVVLALAGAVPGGRIAVEWLVTHVPGGGLVRDGQKFLAWYALPLACTAAAGAGVAAGWAARALRRVPAGRVVVCAAALLPIAALPDLAWGAAGRLTPVTYPAAWHAARESLQANAGPGDLVVLPFQPFRSFPWAGERTILDPAPRYFGRQTVLPDALPVGGRVVPGEDRRAVAVVDALASDDPLRGLAAAGISDVVVLRDTPGVVPRAVTDGARPVADLGTVEVLRVPEAVEPWTERPPTPPVVAADIVFLATLMAASVDLVRNACLRHRRSLRSPVS